MTCKDCVHYEVCKEDVELHRDFYDCLEVDGVEKHCEYFKPKSRFVELPCEVGQTVYSFCDVFGAILPYVVQNFGIGFLGKDRPNYWFWEATSHATETDELLDEIDFDLDDIGKTVFLSREIAEKALKEREKE